MFFTCQQFVGPSFGDMKASTTTFILQFSHNRSTRVGENMFDWPVQLWCPGKGDRLTGQEQIWISQCRNPASVNKSSSSPAWKSNSARMPTHLGADSTSADTTGLQLWKTNLIESPSGPTPKVTLSVNKPQNFQTAIIKCVRGESASMETVQKVRATREKPQFKLEKKEKKK